VQKITSGDYFFRHHLETKVDDKFINSTGEIIRNESLAKETGKLIRISSMPALVKQNPIAIHTNILGTVKLKNFG
jgi:CRISPR-associated endonuclease Csn1